MMVVFSLFPSGVLQVSDVLENGYWHARSLAYTAVARCRVCSSGCGFQAICVFILLGALPIAIAVGQGYLALWKGHQPTGAARPSPAE